MIGKNLIVIGIELFSWLCLFLLTIGLGLFVQDIWNDYQEGKTNDRVYTKRTNYYNHPIISICFEPQVNETTLLKYNKTIEDLNYFTNSKLNLEIPPATFADDVSFKLGRDFTVGLDISGHESNHDYLTVDINGKFDYTVMTMDGKVTPFPKLIQVEELPLFMYGLCTILKISPMIRGSIQLQNNIHLKFKTANVNNLPLVNFFFTSEENSHGAFWNQWMEGEVFAINIDPQNDKTHSVSLKQQVRKKLQKISYCSLDLNYYQCLNKKYVLSFQTIFFSET